MSQTTTTPTDLADATTAVDTYLAMWGEADPAARLALVERAWAPDGRYADPVQEAAGHPALSAMAAGTQATYPGHAFRRTSGVDAHHDAVRFDWALTGPDGATVVAGVDVGILGPDGRFRTILGFFGPTPTADAG